MPFAGAIFPGDAFGDAIAAFGAPVGAGEDEVVWAIAAPAVKHTATEASHSERIKSSMKSCVKGVSEFLAASYRLATWASPNAGQDFSPLPDIKHSSFHRDYV
jgi:hypothetical protein